MSRRRFIALSVVLDALVVNGAIVLAYLIRFGGEIPSFNFAAYAVLWPFITVIYLVAGYVFGLYEPERAKSPWEVVRGVAMAAATGTVATAALAFFSSTRAASFSRLAMVIAFALQVVLLVAWRLLALKLTPIRWPEQRVLIVGTGPVAHELAEELQRRSEWGHRVVGLLTRDGEGRTASGEGALPVLGKMTDAAKVVAEHEVNRVIITSPVNLREVIEELALGNETGVRVEVIPELYEIFIGTVDSTVSDIPLMELTRPTTPGWFLVLKRILDVVFALVLLVLLSPVLLFAALGVLITMGRPVFFTQERVGKDMRRFKVIKFRTMVRDAEQSTGPVLAEENDPRITPFGRLLRRYRIDELPQLLNILKGDMSFVGPRPERPFFVEQYVDEIAGYRERFKAKPGATGLAQVSGSYATTPERKLKFDLIYMYHQNLLMDLQILAETVRVVLNGRGAR
ncbi:MAG: sugar transferase [Coriobacteriales bacterium]|nr:sugar transferase [Actinomycetes bacterium]